VTGPLAQRRQRPRRRRTPNTNTTTTTMISTHNHVDMAASLVGAGPVHGDATAAHPSKQLGHGQAISRSRIDGRATHRLAGPLHPRDLPADLGWPGGCRPAADHAQARWGRALRATPSQPSRSRIDQHHTSGGLGQASSDPTRPQRADRRGMARPSSVCPAWVGEQSKHGCVETQRQTPRRRRRTDGARLRRHPNLRRGRLHRPALPVQPRSALRDPPRVGPAEGNSAAGTPLLIWRGRWSAASCCAASGASALGRDLEQFVPRRLRSASRRRPCDANQCRRQGRTGRRQRVAGGLARVGLIAYAVVHLLVGWLALQLAWEASASKSADTSGALKTLADQPFGKILLWRVALGLVALALWQASEVIWGYRSTRRRRPGLGRVQRRPRLPGSRLSGPLPGVVHGKAGDPLTLASWTTSWARSATLRQGCLVSSRLR
jgi:hypothetical protein